VGCLTNMSFMFENSIFNQDISLWDTRSVTLMFRMFDSSKFNKDISRWNTSNVRVVCLKNLNLIRIYLNGILVQ